MKSINEVGFISFFITAAMIVVFLVSLQGCSSPRLMDFAEKHGGKIGKAVDAYCEYFPIEYRKALRESVKTEDGNSFSAYCFGDEE